MKCKKHKCEMVASPRFKHAVFCPECVTDDTYKPQPKHVAEREKDDGKI